ncbi:MAG: DMT family transporter [Gammaproteobacteria bacterium]|nr:DMT family transporter [Gammaproteobacteria bacterium]MDH3757244.1 DMT family transporter [Gammaproteobacteria bacterium]MDH3846519.1 DMT family transporter [Gammaproteobacteria bacterium]MDH3863433.1 DMT family transporter [Gammaproteobacteria bacterium]MDH3908614.1 DMT family transporter [Gammaproteobacteria bacterium]
MPVEFLKGPHLRLFLGAVLISLSPVWVKLVSVSPTTSGFYRVAIGSVTVAVLMVFARQKLRLSKRAWFLVALAGAFFSLDLFFWHRSIIYVGPGLSTLLANFQVFIMMSAGVVLLRQKPSKMQMLAVPLALLGLVMIVGLDWQSLPDDYRLGIIFGLLTAIMYAGYLLSLRAARVDSENRLPLAEVAVVSIVCTLLLVVIAQAEGVSLAVPDSADIKWLLCYGILSHSFGALLLASSLPHVSTTEAGLALLLQPTLSFVWDVLFFGRPMQAIEIAGAAIALIAIYLGARVRGQ